MKLRRYITVLLFLTFLPGLAGIASAGGSVSGQDSVEVITVKDTVQKKSVWKKIYGYFANANKTSDKKFDISLIGGPHYSTDTKLGLGMVAAGVYNTHRGDSLTPDSNVSLFGDITTTGFYLLGIRGNNIFYREKWRIDYTLYFFSFPSSFWGIGFENGDNDGNACKYMRKQAEIKSDFLIKVADGLYVGPSIGFQLIRGYDFDDFGLSLLNGEERISRYFNYGAQITYDTRDFIPNAYKGVFIKLLQTGYTDFQGKPFFNTTFTFDYYRQAWKGAVFAFDFNTELQYGSVPWTMKASLGGSNRMRGYYEGRYRDDNALSMQIEYRQKIYNRHGIVIWGGCGTIWSKQNRFQWNRFLPNYGIGYRWEFKKRMNVRLDYGFGKKGQSGFMFSINEAF